MRTEKAEPGDILRYRRRPKKGEWLAHNHIIHASDFDQGTNGFRWFSVKAGGGWKPCPCGWRPDLGRHYAAPGHVRWTRGILKKVGGGQEKFDRYIWRRLRRYYASLGIELREGEYS